MSKMATSTWRGPLVSLDEIDGQLLQPESVWFAGDLEHVACKPLDLPGVYVWFFKKAPGPAGLDGCHRWKGHSALYVGISPRKPSGDGASSSRQTVARRLRQHYFGNASGSTLRLSLGCLLEPEIGTRLRLTGSGRVTFGEDGEARLSEWLRSNTFVSAVTCDSPWEAETRLIESGKFPLNLHGNKHEFAAQLGKLRRRMRMIAKS